ncbi:M23 family metallopeptidase [uncultured Sphingomonas sp.]|uniref:M23 family metallopeptidase n=1 Tax=uncultured Sphingomonas sp. TaxID=158754 RepID=UPI0035CB2DCE
MFLRNDHGLEFAGGASGAPFAPRSFGHAAVPGPSALDRARRRAATIDWVPDLGADIGSRVWWRGLVTCGALCAATCALAPGHRPLVGVVPAPLAGSEWDEARAQSIAPLGLGAGTGRRMAANDLVRPLADAPERPTVDLSATLGDGDAFDRVLERAGVGRADAAVAAALLARTTPLAAIQPGTRIQITLGRRPDRTLSRPLDHLALRARFDLNVSIDRIGGGLAMTRSPIAIDTTPLRIQGVVGSSLYRAARAAGAPAKAVEAYLRAIATRFSIGRDVNADDHFDLIVEQDRAATGEIRLGRLLFAGLEQGNRRTELVRFGPEGSDAIDSTTDGSGGGASGDQWYDANGRYERRGFMGLPVMGRISSGFGFRAHPILGFLRMHKGLDIAAPHGAPIHAAENGVVRFAGRNAGYGNFIKLAHPGDLESGYGHLSRIAVAPGERVQRGEVIGYVGSTGMSTGPHLHWEIWRAGRPVNPRSISFDQVSALSGDKLRAFKARVAALLNIRPGAR